MRTFPAWVVAFATLWTTGCERLPGQPDAAQGYVETFCYQQINR